MRLISELKRRNVLRMAMLYMVAAWLIMQVVDVVVDLAKLPGWMGQTTLILLAVGFPIALVFSWFYELTPEGISLEKDVDRELSVTHLTGRRLDFIIIALLLAAVILFAYDKWGVPGAPPNSIAVLPFTDMSEAGDHQYFSDGLAEELLNLLARVQGLSVTSRTSAFSFAGRQADIPEIAAALNVAFILEGSVRRSGDRLRVTAQLIETKSDSHLWSETFDREMSDIFMMQDEIAALVIESLKITLTGEAPVATPTDTEAYAMFLQARHLWRQGSEEGVSSASELLQRVIEIDPDYAPAWEAMSTVYTYQADLGLIPFETAYDRAREAATRVLELDPDNARALAHLGWDAMLITPDYHAAAGYFRSARRIAPDDPAIIGNVATFAAILGRLDEAAGMLSGAITLDPIDSAKYTNLGAFYLAAHRLDEADKSFSKALEFSPDDVWTQQAVVYLRILQGRSRDALKRLEPIEVEFFQLHARPMIYHDLGQTAELDEALKNLEAAVGIQATEYHVAEVYAHLGDADAAFHWLNVAIDGDQNVSHIRLSPFLKRIQNDPRWAETLGKIGLADEQVSGYEF
jgi:TolB-like protein/Tfp pilus assembly protein PilF